MTLAASLAVPSPISHAQDAAARAGAIADRDAADERTKRLNSAVEDLWTAKTEQDKRLNALAEEIRGLKAELAKTDTSRYATRDELRSLAEKLQEIDNKRVADRKLIEDKFADLKTELRKLLNAPAPSTARKPRSAPAADNEEKSGEKSGADKSGARPSESGTAGQEGVWYEIQSGNTLAAVVTAHNEEFKKQGKKTSLKLVQEANPGLKPTSMKIGQKIFIPVVAQ